MARAVRCRLRFSLRTLVLAVLLCASVPLLVRGWCPWYESAWVDLWVEDRPMMVGPRDPKVATRSGVDPKTGERKSTRIEWPRYENAERSALFTRDGSILILCFDTGRDIEEYLGCIQLQAFRLKTMERLWSTVLCPGNEASIIFTPTERFLRVNYSINRKSVPDVQTAINVLTGEQPAWPKELWAEYAKRKPPESTSEVQNKASHDGRRTIAEGKGVRILSTADASELCVLPTTGTFAAWSPCEDLLVTTDEEANARLWKRRRPEAWWGMLWLWEFWLVAVIATGLVWSVWRDRRAFLSCASPRETG